MVNVWKTDWVFRSMDEVNMWVSIHKASTLGLPQSHFSVFKINQSESLILEVIEGFLS